MSDKALFPLGEISLATPPERDLKKVSLTPELADSEKVAETFVQLVAYQEGDEGTLPTRKEVEQMIEALNNKPLEAPEAGVVKFAHKYVEVCKLTEVLLPLYEDREGIVFGGEGRQAADALILYLTEHVSTDELPLFKGLAIILLANARKPFLSSAMEKYLAQV